MSDNIGGISACWYVLEEDVKVCAVLHDKIIVELKDGKEWKEFQCTQTRTAIRVIPDDDGAGTYSASVSVSIPTHKLTKHIDTVLLNNKNILFKYRTGNGQVFVVGSLENFLTVSFRSLTPTEVSGYSGVQINASGTLPHPELPSI